MYEIYASKQNTCLSVAVLSTDGRFARVLYAARKIKKAKDFLKLSPVNIPKNLVSKIENASPNNKIIPIVEEDSEDKNSQNSGKINKSKSNETQFSSEKLLEDELESRILSGVMVFGKKLKMYKRRGEYGRQLIISNKRIDLLAEDEEGNLYVIELKKDSGYDDPYQQIVEYIEWLAKNKVSKGKKYMELFALIVQVRAL